MKTIIKLSVLISSLIFSACSRHFPIKASLYKSPWFASPSNGTPIVSKNLLAEPKLRIIFSTDLPHPELEHKPKGKVNGCKEKCTVTQSLIMSNIPLRAGFYPIAQSESDSFKIVGIYSMYTTMGIKQISSRNYKQANGWVRITDYDSTAGSIKGAFDINFIGKHGRSAYFKRGKLDIKLKKDPLI